MPPLPRVEAGVKRRGERQRDEEKDGGGEKHKMGRRRGVGVEEKGGGGQLCVREAQLGNEKCNPPPRIPPPYTHTYGTHTHTIPISLSSPQERRGGGGGGGGGGERKGEAGGIGRDGEGDR